MGSNVKSNILLICIVISLLFSGVSQASEYFNPFLKENLNEERWNKEVSDSIVKGNSFTEVFMNEKNIDSYVNAILFKAYGYYKGNPVGFAYDARLASYFEASSMSKEWTDFVSETNAFKRKKYQKLFEEKLKEFASFSHSFPTGNIIFNKRISAQYDFDFERMSKTLLIDDYEFNSEYSCSLEGEVRTIDISPDGNSSTNLPGDISFHTLPVTGGNLSKLLSVNPYDNSEKTKKCAIVVEFSDDVKAESFENITRGGNEYRLQVSANVSDDIAILPLKLEIKAAQFIVNEKGKILKSGYEYTAKSSKTAEEWISERVVNEFDSIWFNTAIDKNVISKMISEMVNSPYILKQNKFEYVQFSNKGSEAHFMRRSSTGDTIGKYQGQEFEDYWEWKLETVIKGNEFSEIPLRFMVSKKRSGGALEGLRVNAFSKYILDFDVKLRERLNGELSKM